MHGQKTIVVGNGNGALDAARMALRSHQDVTLLFAGMEEQMGVYADDLALAIEEGVKDLTPYEVVAIESQAQGFVRGVTCRVLDVVEKDNTLSLVASDKPEEFMEAETVILATGSRPNNLLNQHLPQLKVNEDGSFWTDAQTGLTSIEKVFAAGNVATGAGAVVNAIASGKQAAGRIMEFLK